MRAREMKCKHCGSEIIEQEFQTIKHKGKEFRIFKWEDKLFKDFPIPKGFDWAKYVDVLNLANEDKLIFTEPYKEVYICKTQFKRNKNYVLSWLYLCGDSDLGSGYGGLDYSNDSGRVVLVKKEQEK